MPDGKAYADARSATPDVAERSLLSGIHLFDGLSAEELNRLELVCRYRRFGAYETILDRESLSSDICFIVRGHVRIVNYSLGGREIVFDDLHQGEYFGELSAIDGEPRSANAVAMTDSLIVALPRRVFLNLLVEKPAIATRMFLRLAAAIRAADTRIMDLSTLAAINRVQTELLRHARTTAVDANKAVVEPIPIHSDIAGRASTTRETVARVLNDLARKGILERTRTQLIIHDLGRLRGMVEDVRG
jgi:CRP-like cAMP-binding protein